MANNTILQVIWIILIVIAAVVVTFLFLSLLFKSLSFLSLSFKSEVVQKGELVKKKFFVCRDGYQLNWFGEINPQGSKIFVGLHDLGMNGEDFLLFRDYVVKKNAQYSVVSYDQRNYGKNKIQEKRSAGSMILDLQDLVIYLKEKFPQQEIILVGEGLGYYLAIYVANKQPQISKVIGVGLRNSTPYKYDFSNKMAILSGILFSPYKLIKIVGEGKDLCSNSNFVKTIDNNLFEKGKISVKEHFQYQQLKKRSVNNLSKLNQPVLILQGQNDVFVDFKKTNKMMKQTIDSKFQIQYFSDKKHFLLNETDSNQVFASIIDWVK